MKHNANTHRSDLEFFWWEIFLSSTHIDIIYYKDVTKHLCKKLDACYYGPFQVLEKIGIVAYRMQTTCGIAYPIYFSHFSVETCVGTESHRYNLYLWFCPWKMSGWLNWMLCLIHVMILWELWDFDVLERLVIRPK